MLINVATLLKENIGSVRTYRFDDEIYILDEGSGYPVEGEVTLTRTDRGILATGTIQSTVKIMCVRCLTSFKHQVNFNIEEEYFPSVDIETGARLSIPQEDTALVIGGKHMLDLSEVIRQDALLTIPMKPICDENCAGLCAHCGNNLNLGSCDCHERTIDPRWHKLSGNT